MGLSPVAFEASSLLGGIWVYRQDEIQRGPTYRSLRTNTSKQITAFSDLPFRLDLPNFPPRMEVERYLGDYARTFDLERFVRFNAPVESVRPAADGTWTLTSTRAGEESYDAVLVCSGIFRKPIIPAMVGLEGFTGEVTHSLGYRAPERFAGRRVLVVGLGSSAVDIALDLMGSAASVTLSTRRGAWVVPREIEGLPFDHRASRLTLALPAAMRAARRRRALMKEYARRGLDPPECIWGKRHIPFDAHTAPSVTSDDLLPCIQSGAIEAKPGIERILGGEVLFTDGTSVRPEAIIFCTGYTPDFPFLPSHLAPWSNGAGGLYRLVFPPSSPGLAFIGVCRAQGPILPIVEMQARWAASVAAGSRRLPTSAVMRVEIEQRRHVQASRGDSLIRVPLTPYLDQIGREIGVNPALLRHPHLLYPLLTGPPVAAQYRLEGPNRWPAASGAIRLAADVTSFD